MKFFRVRYRKQGGHYHCRIFSSSSRNGTYAKLGDLVLDKDDWEYKFALFTKTVEYIDETGEAHDPA